MQVNHDSNGEDREVQPGAEISQQLSGPRQREQSPLSAMDARVRADVDQSQQADAGVAAARNAVNVERFSDGTAVLTLGAADERAVTFNEERLKSLDSAIEELKTNPPSNGLVITGPRAGVFCMGADLKDFSLIKTPEEAAEVVRFGQELFQKIDNLPFRTVAAINGDAVGGGCELPLNCDYRIMAGHAGAEYNADAEKSSGYKIGLPEGKLQILAAWTGVHKLPRLIGMTKAMPILLEGKTLSAGEALHKGVVDAVVPQEQLVERAREIAAGIDLPKRRGVPLMEKLALLEGMPGKPARWLGTSDSKIAGTIRGWIGMGRKGAMQRIMEDTQGNYPAQPEIFKSVIKGLDEGMQAGFENDQQAMGRLMLSDASKSAQYLFALGQEAKGRAKPARGAFSELHPVIVGAGPMGGGIAGLFVKSANSEDQRTNLRDLNEESLADGVGRIQEVLSHSKALNDATKAVKLDRLDATLGDSVEWIGSTNVVIEAVSENPDIKKKVLAGIAAEVPADALIGTNTSSLSVTDLAAAVPNPERFVGIHFFNPPGAMPLVEIVRGEQTSDETVAKACALAGRLGKTPIVVEDVPCFLVNRMFAPYLNEAAFLLGEGASIKQIDKAAQQFGMRMGPLRTLDEVGFDIAGAVASNAEKGYGNRMQGPDYVSKLQELGLLGRKGGEGFYTYRGEWDKKGVPNKELAEMIGIEKIPFKSRMLSDELIQQRLSLIMVNEAVRALDEGVAGSNSAGAAARQIDLGSVFGMGFAPFRGGVMKHAESMGAWDVLKGLRELESKYGSRFAPALGIIKRAQMGKSFYEEV